MKEKIRICLISDTHGKHHELNNLPEADIIIHDGDLTSIGLKSQLQDFLDWFSSLEQYVHRVFIGGNHDYFLDFAHQKSVGTQEQLDEMMPSNIIYLNDSGIALEGLNIWGSPIQPWFYNWSFNRLPGEDIQKHWNLIPNDIDILCTHGPPANTRLDRCVDGKRAGCISLMNKILDIDSILLSTFGHIHEGYGDDLWEIGEDDNKRNITLINASVLNRNYEMVNKPYLIEVDKKNKTVEIIEY